MEERTRLKTVWGDEGNTKKYEWMWLKDVNRR